MADEKPRYALVIGNAAYESEQPLVNTLNDARDVAAKLKQLGFEVDQVENAGRRRLGRVVNDFLRKVQNSSAVALFYYSGHGLQVNGQNFLIPVDAQVRDELDVPIEGLALNRILAGLGNRGDDAVNLIVLDACRNNPFKMDGAKAIGDKGLARVTAPSGTLIFYATRPGDTATDNPTQRNGLFTKYLLEAMDDTGVQVEETYKKIARNVYSESGHRQSPWQEGVIYGRFYFVPPPASGLAPGMGGSPGLDAELLFWQASIQCDTASCYQEYLKTYPQGRFAGLARAQVQKLQGIRTQPLQQQDGESLYTDAAAVEDGLALTRQERQGVQGALNLLGYEVGSADGIWGQNTRQGIRAWQASEKLVATGFLTAEGYRKLLTLAESVRTVERKRKERQREEQEARAQQAAKLAVAPREQKRPSVGRLSTGRPRVRLNTSLGAIVLELYPDKAPASVANFLRYVDEGYYESTVFHRVISGFMVQGGGFGTDLEQRSTHGPIQNEAANGLNNKRGTLTMARTSAPHSATAQFFINLADNTFLDYRESSEKGWGYCVFGRVVDGMDVVDAISRLSTSVRSNGMRDVPDQLPVITRAARI